MKRTIGSVTVVALLLGSGAWAQSLYKSVDEQGQVTFSDSPPANAVNVEQVEVQPGPTAVQQQEGIDRMKRMESQASELGEANAQRAEERKEMQQQAQQGQDDVQPVTEYNNDRAYQGRPVYPPIVRPPIHPVHPIAPARPGGPGMAVPLPAGSGIGSGR